MDRNRVSITELARELRKNPTPTEKLFWDSVRKRQLSGMRFLRQKPIVHTETNGRKYFYIADFYCAEFKLVIEIDGKVHDYQKENDYNRDIVLNRLGLLVIRFRNEELNDMKSVHRKIEELISE